MKKNKMNIKGEAQQDMGVSPDNFFKNLMSIAKKQSMEIPEHHRIAPRFKIYEVTGDGHCIVATSPADFLHQLHIGSRFDSEGTDTEYMYRFANRLQELEGYIVSTESPEAFLADLIAHGFVSAK